MTNFSSPETPRPQIDWSPDEVVKQKEKHKGTLVQWWYATTSTQEVTSNASFVKREAARKSQLLSTVLFYYSIVVVVFLPCCLFLSHPTITWADGGLILSAIVALILNRNGFTLSSALVVVIMFELMLTVALLITTPLDGPSIQLYDLYIIAELLAVSLLPVRNVFIFAVFNSLVILASLLYQPHTHFLNLDLQTQLIPTLIRPIALQFLVAGVSYVWVYSTTRAIARADRAEMIATLEHALGDQKKDLEDGIEKILQTHVAIANGNLNARAPLTQDNALWQIARALNTLLVRLQRAVQAERELQRVEQAITTSVRTVQQAEQQQQAPQIPFTQTAIDPLIAVVQGKTIAYIQPPNVQASRMYAQFPSENQHPYLPPPQFKHS